MTVDPDTNVVRLDKANLADIPTMLRNMADVIEARALGYENVETVLVLVPVEGDWPRVFQFGKVGGRLDPALVCEMAKTWLVENLVTRR